MTIPPHTGTATLRFDLHNRFDVPAPALPLGLAYARHLAVVAVIRPTGELIGRAAVAGDFRTVDNLFDQVVADPRRAACTGGRPGAGRSHQHHRPRRRLVGRHRRHATQSRARAPVKRVTTHQAARWPWSAACAWNTAPARKTTTVNEMLDLIIVGAGPAGLAAAIAARHAGPLLSRHREGRAGPFAPAFSDDMVFFTTPELLEIGGLPFVSPHEKPTRHGGLALLPPRDRHVRD